MTNNKIDMKKKIIISLTTFCGQCVEAIHYYVSVKYYDSCNDFRNDKIRRPITQQEIDSIYTKRENRRNALILGKKQLKQQQGTSQLMT